jgi:hypothetical protein
MLLRRLARSVLVTSGAVVLVVGVTAALVMLDHLRHSAPVRKTPSQRPKTVVKGERSDYFEVRRTRSELGYTYWILKGHGAFQCFELFDTWKEAVTEASVRSERAAFA